MTVETKSKRWVIDPKSLSLIQCFLGIVNNKFVLIIEGCPFVFKDFCSEEVTRGSHALINIMAATAKQQFFFLDNHTIFIIVLRIENPF